MPTIGDYMENAYISFALGPIVLPALYLVGPKLSDEVTENHELNYLYKLMSTCGRLLNDIHSFKVYSPSLLFDPLPGFMATNVFIFAVERI